MTIPFIDLKAQYQTLKVDIDSGIQRVLDHGQYIMGPEMHTLEAELQTYTGAKHCLTVSSGTDALLIALMALGVGPGDEVITTPFTFVATAEVIVLTGATPVFVDVEPDTCNINSDLIEAAITSKTKAIIPVSLYGQVSDMDEINAVAKKHNITVIEDAAQSFGATYKGRKSCNLSTIACTSFFPSKPLGCYGDGGAIFTNNDVLAAAMSELRVHGQSKRYYHTRIGIGGRMDTLQCAIVSAKLKHFDWELKRREESGDRFINALVGLSGLQLPTIRPDRDCIWGQFTLQVDDREEFVASLKESGVPTAVHYPVPLHMQPAYKDISRIAGSLACSHHVANRVVSLPMHAYMDGKTQTTIIEAVAKALGWSETELPQVVGL